MVLKKMVPISSKESVSNQWKLYLPPPPPRSELFAALTIASISKVVMSPLQIDTLAFRDSLTSYFEDLFNCFFARKHLKLNI